MSSLDSRNTSIYVLCINKLAIRLLWLRISDVYSHSLHSSNANCKMATARPSVSWNKQPIEVDCQANAKECEQLEYVWPECSQLYALLDQSNCAVCAPPKTKSNSQWREAKPAAGSDSKRRNLDYHFPFITSGWGSALGPLRICEYVDSVDFLRQSKHHSVNHSKSQKSLALAHIWLSTDKSPTRIPAEEWRMPRM